MLLPTKKQWKRWSYPSKLSYIGCLLGVVALVLGLFAYFYPRPSTTQMMPPSEEAILCPDPIPFREEVVEPQFGATFATRVSLTTPEKIFRARIYTHTFIDRAVLEQALGTGPRAVTSGEGSQVAEVIAPHGATEIRVVLHASENVRLVCVERVN